MGDVQTMVPAVISLGYRLHLAMKSGDQRMPRRPGDCTVVPGSHHGRVRHHINKLDASRPAPWHAGQQFRVFANELSRRVAVT